jgi:predicted nuclease of predicted toxin-antitoxin system
MKFLLDQDVYAITARFLAGLGHDVVTVSSIGLSAADDSVLLTRANDEGRIFVTRDRDFGGLVFVQKAGPGVMYLRITPATVQAVHGEVGIVLGRYTAADLQKAFVVVEPGRHRHRRVGP